MQIFFIAVVKSTAATLFNEMEIFLIEVGPNKIKMEEKWQSKTHNHREVMIHFTLQYIFLLFCFFVLGLYRPYAHDVISVERPHLRRLFIGQYCMPCIQICASWLFCHCFSSKMAAGWPLPVWNTMKRWTPQGNYLFNLGPQGNYLFNLGPQRVFFRQGNNRTTLPGPQ